MFFKLRSSYSVMRHIEINLLYYSIVFIVCKKYYVQIIKLVDISS